MNLLSFVNAWGDMNENEFEELKGKSNIGISNEEVEAISSLLDEIKIHGGDILLLDSFIIGYKIRQIGKEFDLLKFSDNYNINIELKSKFNEEKILKQLVRNEYYLKFLENKTHYFTYCSDRKKIYTFSEDRKCLEEVNWSHLIEIIQSQNDCLYNKIQVDSFFDPKNYLVSPFNDTEKFIDSSYFLTNAQEKIIRSILNKVRVGSHFFAISGSAGTGKTLLLYRLVKEAMDNDYKTLVVHCGKLNSGHYDLGLKHKWNITQIKDMDNKLNSELDFIFIDETQRIRPYQLEQLVQFCSDNNISCVFSLDKEQCLHNDEIRFNIFDKIREIVNKSDFHKLTNKIRTNPEMANFVKLLFSHPIGLKNTIPNLEENIIVNYFNDINNAKKYLCIQQKKGWKMLGYTPSRYSKDPLRRLDLGENPHDVIGQEFDRVVVIIDRNFYYEQDIDEDKLLLNGTTDSYYHSTKMLFQLVTRAREKINLVIVENIQLYDEVLSLLDNIS